MEVTPLIIDSANPKFFFRSIIFIDLKPVIFFKYFLTSNTLNDSLSLVLGPSL